MGHLLADFSFSRPLDACLWGQVMGMSGNMTYGWCSVGGRHLLGGGCRGFSWLFAASRCSPGGGSICACGVACGVLVSVGLWSLSFGFLKEGFVLGKPYPEIR